MTTTDIKYPEEARADHDERLLRLMRFKRRSHEVHAQRLTNGMWPVEDKDDDRVRQMDTRLSAWSVLNKAFSGESELTESGEFNEKYTPLTSAAMRVVEEAT